MKPPAMFLFPLLLTGWLSAADWPMGGRSANRNPVSPETNPAVDWQFGGDGMIPRNIRWTAAVGSRAGGGPVVSGGLVWVGTNNESADEERADRAILACFRESDGKPLYRYQSSRRGNQTTDWPKQSLTGSPLAEGDRLWFITNRREVICLDTGPLRRSTGDPRILWKLDMVEELKVHPGSVMIPWGDALGSPSAYEEFLYVPTGNARLPWGEKPAVPAPDAPSLVCLRKDTGKVVWSDNSPGPNLLYGQCASPLVIEVAGRAMVIHPQGDGWVRTFDAKTGKLIWKFDVNPKSAKGDGALGDGDRVYVVSTPVYDDGKVFFSTGLEPESGTGDTDGRLFSIDPTKSGDLSPELDASNGQGKPNPNSAVVWEFKSAGASKSDTMHLSVSSVAVHDGLVFAVDTSGFVHCLDAKTGKQHWVHDVKGAIYGNPLVVGDKLYVATSGEVLVLDAKAAKRVAHSAETNHTISASPVFANGMLYVLTDGILYSIQAKK